MKRLFVILPVVAVVVGFLVWWLSPTQQVKRQTGKLMKTLTVEQGTSPAVRQLGGYSLNGLIAKELILETPTISEANGTFEREQIETGFSWMVGQAKFTKFKVRDFETVEVNGTRAKVTAIIEGTVAFALYRPVDGPYRVEMDWEKEEDGWHLSRAKWTESR